MTLGYDITDNQIPKNELNTISYKSDNHYVVIPENHNVVGTCGKCGGPIISPMIWTTTESRESAPEWCMNCGSKPKKIVYPNYGPVREME